ncbi:MAG: hypothetical protein MHM6MM_001561 [Cercozoa sp. M6MM]
MLQRAVAATRRKCGHLSASRAFAVSEVPMTMGKWIPREDDQFHEELQRWGLEEWSTFQNDLTPEERTAEDRAFVEAYAHVVEQNEANNDYTRMLSARPTQPTVKDRAVDPLEPTRFQEHLTGVRMTTAADHGLNKIKGWSFEPNAEFKVLFEDPTEHFSGQLTDNGPTRVLPREDGYRVEDGKIIRRAALPQPGDFKLPSMLEVEGLSTFYNIGHKFVSHTRRMGRVQRIKTMVVVGNGRGLVGWGIGSHERSDVASEAAFAMARRNVMFVPRYQDSALFHNLECKVLGQRVKLFATPEGHGKMSSPLAMTLLECAGIRNVSVKTYGTRTPFIVISAIWKALQQHNDAQTVVHRRGRDFATAVPQLDEFAYHMVPGFEHASVAEARRVLQNHMKQYSASAVRESPNLHAHQVFNPDLWETTNSQVTSPDGAE